MKYFLIQHHFVFVDMKYFFVLHQLFFRWHEILFRATSTRFSRHQITFCVTSDFFFQHKIIFRATPNFCLGHRLECYVLMICFYCHIANENIITCQKINKLSFLCDTKKLVSFFCASQFFCITVFRLHIVGMLIFFVVVLETKKLLIHLLLTCLIYRSSY